MIDTIMSTLKYIPSEIIYTNILPYIPKYDLSPSFLRKFTMKLLFYQQIQKFLHLKDVDLKRDVFLNFSVKKPYVYEKNGILLYADFCPKNRKIVDYVCILS